MYLLDMNCRKKNILLISGYRIFSRMYFYLPIMFPLLYLSGESILHIEILLAIYGIATVLSLPMAGFAIKKIGHKYIIILGEILRIIGLIILTLYAGNLLWTSAAQIFMGIGYAFVVGNDTIILQQIFKQVNSEEYQSVQAKTNSYMFLALLFSGLIGAIVFKYNITLVLLFSIVAAILSILSISCLDFKKVDEFSKSASSELVKNDAAMYYSLIRGVVLSFFVGLFPYFFLIKFNTDIISFGIVITCFTISGFLSSKYLARHLKRYSFDWLISRSSFLVLVGLSLFLLNNVYFGFLAAFILGGISGCVRPITISKIDNNFYSVEKTLKKAEYNYAILSAALLISAGVYIKYVGFYSYIISVIVLLFFLILFKTYYQLKEVKL